MKYILTLLLILTTFALPHSVLAADAPPPKADISKLVTTLEDDNARADLIKQLKLMQSAEDAQHPVVAAIENLSVSEQLGLRKTFGGLIAQYEDFLNRYAISSSLVHQSMGTTFTLFLTIGLYFGVRRLAARILRGVDNLSEKVGLRLTRLGIYTNVLQFILKILIVGLSVYTLGKIWDVPALDSFFEGPTLRRMMGTFLTFMLVAFIAALIWEAIGAYLAYILKQADDNNQTRVKTLLPMIRNIVMSVFALLFGLILLSEVGINVGPLIAGAGVIGVAIGFGAQSMVKDFLTGFTIVLEDIIRVGDVVNIGTATGVVEKITLRKIQLRDVAGTVYTIPFSHISTVQNLTKDYSFCVLDIGVAYDSNIDHVAKVMRNVDDAMRADEAFAPLILAPIEIFGLDRFGDNAMIIKARIKTLPIKQWDVGREFNRRLKVAFDAEGIEFPYPQRTITIKNAASIA